MVEWLEKHRSMLPTAFSATLIVAILTGGAVLVWRRPQPAPIVIASITPLPVASPDPTTTPAPILAYVTGAVARPGVYSLPCDSRVEDAITAAGGAAADADLLAINLAEHVHDAQQIYVPHQGENATPILPTAIPTAYSDSGQLPGGQLVNINTAAAQQLEALPGIGPALAQRIIDYRTANGPFQSIEDITNVKGIGQHTFEQLQDQITVR